MAVFGLMAGGEVVRFFQERDSRTRQRQRQPKPQRKGPRSITSTTGNHGETRGRLVREGWWRRFMARVPFAAATRVASAVVGAAAMVVSHVRLHGGAGVREWGILENDISILARWVLGVTLVGHSNPEKFPPRNQWKAFLGGYSSRHEHTSVVNNRTWSYTVAAYVRHAATCLPHTTQSQGESAVVCLHARRVRLQAPVAGQALLRLGF